MKYYFNFIFIIVFDQLLVIQTKNSTLETSYQKLWNKKTQTKSHTFSDQFYSKIKIQKSANASTHTLHINKRDTYYRRTCHSTLKECFTLYEHWCCSKQLVCGRIRGVCDQSTSELMVIPLQLFLCACGFLLKWCCHDNCDAVVPSTNISTIEQPQIPTNSARQSSSIYRQNFNQQRSIETQSQRVSTTSSLPPAYDTVMRENSVTISEEHQSMLPPSYNDFMRRINESDSLV